VISDLAQGHEISIPLGDPGHGRALEDQVQDRGGGWLEDLLSD